MREPAFWWRESGVAAQLLAPVAAAYGAIAAWRLARPGHRSGIPALCIGNLTLGGTGKTPAARAAAALLRQAGKRPFVLTCGYGGRLSGPLRIDAAVHRAREVGDEALLLARDGPAILAADRVAGATMARKQGADVIVMDDGFQNPALAKDLSLLVVDGRRGIGNAATFPAGPLRAPLAPQLDRAHAILLIEQGQAAGGVLEPVGERGLPVFHGRLTPDPDAVAALKGQRVLAFAGIGDPRKFFVTLAEAGIEIAGHRAFADHHRFGRGEAAALLQHADRNGLVLVTTEKDMARMIGEDDLATLAARSHTLPVTLEIEEQAEFRDLLLKAAG